MVCRWFLVCQKINFHLWREKVPPWNPKNLIFIGAKYPIRRTNCRNSGSMIFAMPTTPTTLPQETPRRSYRSGRTRQRLFHGPRLCALYPNSAGGSALAKLTDDILRKMLRLLRPRSNLCQKSFILNFYWDIALSMPGRFCPHPLLFILSSALTQAAIQSYSSYQSY